MGLGLRRSEAHLDNRRLSELLISACECVRILSPQEIIGSQFSDSKKDVILEKSAFGLGERGCDFGGVSRKYCAGSVGAAERAGRERLKCKGIGSGNASTFKSRKVFVDKSSHLRAPGAVVDGGGEGEEFR